MTQNKENPAQIAASEVVAEMTDSVRRSCGQADSSAFDLYQLAAGALKDVDNDVMIALAVELLVHKGRQAAASQVKAPEYLGPEAPVGKFPRSVPIDNKGTSTYIDFWHATTKQIALAIGSRRMMEEGLGYRVMELQGRFAAMVELESAEPVKEIES